MPPAIGGVHFSPVLRTFIMYQYDNAHITHSVLLGQLQEWGLDMSAGQLSALMTAGHDELHREKDALLQTPLQRSPYTQNDDNGARHASNNGYCTHIGNEMIASFASTDRKSGLNFLCFLRAGQDDYTVNDAVLAYMHKQSMPKALQHHLAITARTTEQSGRQLHRHPLPMSAGETGRRMTS